MEPDDIGAAFGNGPQGAGDPFDNDEHDDDDFPAAGNRRSRPRTMPGGDPNGNWNAPQGNVYAPQGYGAGRRAGPRPTLAVGHGARKQELSTCPHKPQGRAVHGATAPHFEAAVICRRAGAVLQCGVAGGAVVRCGERFL